MVLEKLRRRRSEIHEVAAKHGVTRIQVFGSVARGEDRADSDVDFLVETGQETSSWFPAGLILDLQSILGRRIEIVEEKGLHSSLRDHIVHDAVPL